MTKRMKWTDELVKEHILEAMEELGIDRMPTNDELKSINRHALRAKINKSKKFSGWAKEMNLSLKVPPVLYGDVKLVFESRGYTLLSTEYERNDDYLYFSCPKHQGKELKITYNALQGGNGCKYCGKESAAALIKTPYEIVKKAFYAKGLELLETEYKNKDTKMKYRCMKHPTVIQSTYYSSVRDGRGCFICGRLICASKNSGEDNKLWKGGLTELNAYLRSLLNEWKYITLLENDWRCCITGSKNDLQIHHSNSFYILRDEMFKELNLPIYQKISDYTPEQIELMSRRFKEIHKKEIGFPVTKAIHKEFHKRYGNTTSISDFKEFQSSYKSHKRVRTMQMNLFERIDS